jgi:DHA3 family tetracycline resistance protein-like MFS transporter
MNALGEIIGGPFIGIIATKISISFGIACTAMLLMPVIVLYVISIMNDKHIKNNWICKLNSQQIEY